MKSELLNLGELKPDTIERIYNTALTVFQSNASRKLYFDLSNDQVELKQIERNAQICGYFLVASIASKPKKKDMYVNIQVVYCGCVDIDVRSFYENKMDARPKKLKNNNPSCKHSKRRISRIKPYLYTRKSDFLNELPDSELAQIVRESNNQLDGTQPISSSLYEIYTSNSVVSYPVNAIESYVRTKIKKQVKTTDL
jgi:hypothetical protein